MTAEEAKAHFAKLAQEAGLSKEQTDGVLQAMDNEKFRGGLSTGYKRHDEYSRDMDALRTERERLRQWYEREELPKYQLYTQSATELQRYRDRYGQLDEQGLNNGQGGMGNGNGFAAGMTKDEIARYVAEQLRQRDNAYVQLVKDSATIPMDHYQRFGKALSKEDVNEIEQVALKNGVVFEQGYKIWVAPKERDALEARHKEEIEKAKAEAVRDYQSRLKLPVESKPREAHPFFDRKTEDKPLSETDQSRHSRDAFFEGWNNYQTELQKP